jgi:hypothetical protein
MVEIQVQKLEKVKYENLYFYSMIDSLHSFETSTTKLTGADVTEKPEALSKVSFTQYSRTGSAHDIRQNRTPSIRIN